ncbi:MAG: hypothetical protein U9N87_06405, partial [Planctomycetota bacterium]|nr:hypothetical protein [Planctomycetota bacterium]
MISAEKFIDLLEEKDLLPSEMVAKLRRQVAKSSKTVPATAIAKRLIEKGYLTRPLAKRLLATSDQVSKSKPKPKESLELSDDDDTVVEDEDLELEVLDPTEADSAEPEEEDELEPVEAEPLEAMPVAGEPFAGEVVTGDIVTGEVVADAQTPPGVLADPAMDVSAVEDAGRLSSAKRKKGIIGKIMPTRDRRRKANIWDSSLLLLGGGGLTVLVILAGVFIWVFW